MAARAVRIAVPGLVAALLIGCAGARGPAGASGVPVRAGATTSAGSSPRGATAPALAVGRAAWVAVSVATLWHTPDSPRPVDAAALRAPAEIGRWLAAMTV